MPLPPSRPPSPVSRVLILGSGNFGSCLADHLADSSHKVSLWCRSAETAKSMNLHHRNPKYLKDHVFHDSIEAIDGEAPPLERLKETDVVLFAVPTQGLRSLLGTMQSTLKSLGELPLLIFVNKGIETDTQALTLEIVADTCGAEVAKVATFISGPSFAKEIVKRQPTSVSVVSLSQAHADEASNLFHQPWFRCYTGQDPIGVELAGALKNVYAIAAGIADGLGYESNTKAAIITRSLSEMTRVGVAYGASPLTFLSLAGVGDLLLTCSSPTSRNYTVGYRLGKGEKLDDILENLGSVAEGVTTTLGAKRMIDELGERASIITGVYNVLYEGTPAQEAAFNLMTSPPVEELTLPKSSRARAILVKLGLEKD